MTQSTYGRISQSRKGFEDSATWIVEDGTKFHIIIRTLRGDWMGNPIISAKLLDSNYDVIETHRGRLNTLNSWLHERSLVL